MTEAWKELLVGVGANALLLALVYYLLNRRLQHQAEQLKNLNAIALTRFSKFHGDAVNAIAEAYGLLIDAHNAVFMYCFPDRDSGDDSLEDREFTASTAMVKFYTTFRKSEIFMPPRTSERFESSFRFLQSAFIKKTPLDGEAPRVEVGKQVLADLTKTFPDLLSDLREDIKEVIGPEQDTARYALSRKRE